MQIDSRTSRDIFNYLKACAPDFLPHSEKIFEDGSAGFAFAKIVSEMAELVIRRLNKAPDNNYLAFLDMLGVKLLPPQPAIVPVTFSISKGVPGVLIPKRSAVSTGDITFETDKAIWAVPEMLMTAYSYDPKKDRISLCPKSVVAGVNNNATEYKLSNSAEAGCRMLFLDNPTGLNKNDQLVIDNKEYVTIAEVKDTTITLVRPLESEHKILENEISKLKKDVIVKTVSDFNIQRGENLQEHILYIGHSDLFNVKSATTFVLSGENISQLYGLGLFWEYWGKTASSNNEEWCPFTGTLNREPSKDELSKDELYTLLLNKVAGEIVKTKINGIESRWIRCRSTLRAITVSVNFAIKPDSELIPELIDAAFYNDMPVQLQSPILPFNERPRLHDAFYLASQEAFSKPGAIIELTLEKFGEHVITSKPSLLWEYWNGINWTVLKIDNGLRKTLEQEDFNLVNNYNDDEKNTIRKIKFHCPADFKDCQVAGQMNKWIRIRLISGNYGDEKYFNGTGWVPENFKVPKLASITLNYTQDSEILPDYCMTYNNLTWNDYTKQIIAKNGIDPFKKLESATAENAIVYFAFNGKLQNGPICLYFKLNRDLPLSESLKCPVRWYYYTENTGWIQLDRTDNTNNLTRSGTVEINVPTDFSTQMLFGLNCYWIKATFEGTIPITLPLIEKIYLNTVIATQSETVNNEILGGSDTKPDQKFILKRTPVIDCELWIDEFHSLSEEEKVVLDKKGISYQIISGRFGIGEQCWVKWNCTENLFDSDGDDRVYTIDVAHGEITFGNGINGMIPPPGNDNIKATYRVGGGSKGNIPENTIKNLNSSVLYVEKVFNPEPAHGGADGETIESVKKRGPYIINHRNRAVTLQDFERIALQSSTNVKRVKGYTIGNEVHLIVVPVGTDDQPKPSLTEKESIERHLTKCCINTVLPQNIIVEPPTYVPVNIAVDVVPVSMEQIVPVQKAIQKSLNKLLHPITGGMEGNGWEFGRSVHISDIHAILGKIPEVDHLVKIQFINVKANDSTNDVNSANNVNSESFTIEENDIVCSGVHTITVTMKG